MSVDTLIGKGEGGQSVFLSDAVYRLAKSLGRGESRNNNKHLFAGEEDNGLKTRWDRSYATEIRIEWGEG